MKFTTSQGAILKALTLVLGGVSKHAEIFSTVKIKANKLSGIVTFETTNLDIAISSTLACNIDHPGELCIDVAKLTEIIKKLTPLTEVYFETKDYTLNIKNGKSKFHINGLDSEDYPQIKLSEAKMAFKIMSKKVLFLIDKTKSSIYPNETRFNLNGMLLHFRQEISGEEDAFYLNAVTTDGHRLSFAKIRAEGVLLPSFPKIIIPKKTVMELRKCLESLDDEEMEIKLMEKQVSFTTKSFNLLTKLIDAEFPKYESVIPMENDELIVIQKKALISLVERVGTIYTNSSENNIRLHFTGNLLTISATNKDAGNATDELQVERDGKAEIEVSYNYNYLLEILSHISSEKVRFFLKDGKPALIKDEAQENYLYVLMPMRL